MTITITKTLPSIVELPNGDRISVSQALNQAHRLITNPKGFVDWQEEAILKDLRSLIQSVER